MPVEVVLDTYPENQFRGVVTSVTTVAQETGPRTLRRAFHVTVSLDETDPERMRPGMSVKAQVQRVLGREIYSGAHRANDMLRFPIGLSRRTLALGIASVAFFLAALSGIAHLVEGTGPDWTTIERTDLSLTVDVSERLQAVYSQALGPPAVKWMWEFQIEDMAPEGSEVEKGEVVLAFDTTELERRLQEITAAYDSARKELEKKEAGIAIQRRNHALRMAEAKANRQKAALKLDRPRQFVAANELAKVRIDLDTFEKEIAYLQDREKSLEVAFEAETAVLRGERDRVAGRLQEIKAAITAMAVKAPRSGTVIHTTDGRGEKKKVGDPCWRAERVLEIPDLTKMTAEGEVDEVDAGKLAVGQSVKLRLEA